MASRSERKLLETLNGRKYPTPPVWMMRQAGRHLPEYLELRSRAKDFLDFCYSPSLATEATLQPIRRYGMDGAILFADILLILDAMGRNVRFVKGEGPKVDPIEKASDLNVVALESVIDRMSPVYETVERVRSALPDETTLIGFAGSPWTVSVYAIEGKGGGDKAVSRNWGFRHPDELKATLSILAHGTAHYLKRQADAGADALMLFESWAEGLDSQAFRDWVIQPNALIVKQLRDWGVDVPIIGFPRGSGAMLAEYVEKTGVTAVGLDTAVPPEWADNALPEGFPVQGNLDPQRLVAGGDGLISRTREIVSAFKNRPHIFNLGHGITPETPIPNVEAVLKTIRSEA